MSNPDHNYSQFSSESIGFVNTSCRYSSITRLNGRDKLGKMHGPRRVAVFCLLTAVLPTLLIIIPLYLRHCIFADVFYPVAESDIFEIHEGMSSIFCQEHILQMNTTFNAYQLSNLPEIENNRKHIRLKKSMELPDDTLEYWGFYLLKGSTVGLKVCSRHAGSKILVVRGERNLRTCGLLEHNKNKPNYDRDYKQVKVTFETAAQEIIDSGEKDTFAIKIQKNKTNLAVQNEDENTGAEVSDEDIDALRQQAEEYIRKHRNKDKHSKRHELKRIQEEFEEQNQPDDSRNVKRRFEEDTEQQTTQKPEVLLEKTENDELDRKKRELIGNNYDEEQQQEQDVIVESGKRLKYSDVFPKKQQKSRLGTNLRKRWQSTTKNQDVTSEKSYKKQLLQLELNEHHTRIKRETGHKLDGAIGHGGNAINHTVTVSGESNSQSSFETNLLNCYDGHILLSQDFPSSNQCDDISYLARGEHMQMIHEVSSDGYYYYIFYSDNDLDTNHIHAVFDIHKPTFRYTNVSETKQCINMTQCNFTVAFFSDETVIVEVPTRDGIEHEDDEMTLTSKCKPRMAVYIFFPIAVLFLILACAFL